MRQRRIAGLLAGTLAAGLFAAAAPRVQAGSGGRKNTAIGLGAIAAYELLRGEGTKGLIAGAAAAYAYKRYQDARKAERYRDRYYSNRYYSGTRYPRPSYRTYGTRYSRVSPGTSLAPGTRVAAYRKTYRTTRRRHRRHQARLAG